jgi:hypothetical protein
MKDMQMYIFFADTSARVCLNLADVRINVIIVNALRYVASLIESVKSCVSCLGAPMALQVSLRGWLPRISPVSSAIGAWVDTFQAVNGRIAFNGICMGRGHIRARVQADMQYV